MSNMLTEKRAEFINRLNALETARKAEIDAKVNAYRASLEEATPNDDILKIKTVIAALDEVIGYEATLATTQRVDVESVAHATSARPGMSSVVSPLRG